MGKLVEKFNACRAKMNEKILSSDDRVLKRIYSFDSLMFQDGVPAIKKKEMTGLTTSKVLRCDDCINYHLERCFELGTTTQEIFEVSVIANVAGGTIVIPHTRRAVEYWDELPG